VIVAVERRREPRPDTWGYLAFLIWTLVLVAVLPPARLGWLLGSVLVFAGIWRRQALLILLRRRTWFTLAILLLLSGLTLGPRDLGPTWFRLSREGLWAGLGMILRGLSILLAFSASIGALSVARLSAVFERLGLKGLGFAFGVAVNLSASLQDIILVTYHTLRQRGAFRLNRRLFHNLRPFLLGIFANALRHGDEVVLAASARAFDPERPAGSPIPLTAGDIALIILLLAALVLLLT
jgi:energy-coupling factor transporter transmembrane protein EcfT